MPGLIGPSSRTDTKSERGATVASAERRPHLEGRNLLKGFGQGETRTLAVNDVSLKLYRGELTLLMGPSGSGKSTLLAMISGLLRPDEGQVAALNENMWVQTKVQMERFRLKWCSYIFQGCNLFPALTARQQLELVVRWGEGAGGREAKRRSQEMLEVLGLGKKAHLRPGQLSGGEKQRVAIARALVKRPELMFADEPTSALDWENGQQVIEMLHQAAHERSAMVLVVTHDHRLMPYADRVFHMEDGRLISEEQPKGHAVPGAAAHLVRPKAPEPVAVAAAEESDPYIIPLYPQQQSQEPKRVSLSGLMGEVSVRF